jgi:hypothetical protein
MKINTPKSAYKRIGPDLVQAVANTYEKWLESPTAANRKKYLTWRLRIHLRCNVFLRQPLEIVNEHFHLGLNDEEAGPLMWDYEEG